MTFYDKGLRGGLDGELAHDFNENIQNRLFHLIEAFTDIKTDTVLPAQGKELIAAHHGGGMAK